MVFILLWHPQLLVHDRHSGNSGGRSWPGQLAEGTESIPGDVGAEAMNTVGCRGTLRIRGFQLSAGRAHCPLSSNSEAAKFAAEERGQDLIISSGLDISS